MYEQPRRVAIMKGRRGGLAYNDKNITLEERKNRVDVMAEKLKRKIELNEKFSLQPNDFLGLREDLTPQVFTNFAKKAFEDGAKFLKGCCNIMPSHVKALSLEMQN